RRSVDFATPAVRPMVGRGEAGLEFLDRGVRFLESLRAGVRRLDRGPHSRNASSSSCCESIPSFSPGASTWKVKTRSPRARVFLGSSCRSAPAAALRGLEYGGSPAFSRCLLVSANWLFGK